MRRNSQSEAENVGQNEEEEGLPRGGGRGTFERRRKRDFREEEEEVVTRGGGGTYERRKRDL